MAINKNRDSLVWGIILIAVGAVVLFETLHVHVFDVIWKLWPVIFILWGGSKLYYGLKERDKAPQDKGHEI